MNLSVSAPDYLVGIDLSERVKQHQLRPCEVAAGEAETAVSAWCPPADVGRLLRVIQAWAKAHGLTTVELRVERRRYTLTLESPITWIDVRPGTDAEALFGRIRLN
jgi:hypothetical protein